MTKRIYKKPKIKFEDFRMNTKIAACGVVGKMNENGDSNTIAIWDPDWLGGQWIFNVGYPNGMCIEGEECYHLPTDISEIMEEMEVFSAS